MKTQNIKQLFDETSKILSTLSAVSSSEGIHLDNNLETGLLELLFRNDINEMTLLKYRIEVAIKQIKDGTFKIRDIENLHQAKAA